MNKSNKCEECDGSGKFESTVCCGVWSQGGDCPDCDGNGFIIINT